MARRKQELSYEEALASLLGMIGHDVRVLIFLHSPMIMIACLEGSLVMAEDQREQMLDTFNIPLPGAARALSQEILSFALTGKDKKFVGAFNVSKALFETGQSVNELQGLVLFMGAHAFVVEKL